MLPPTRSRLLLAVAVGGALLLGAAGCGGSPTSGHTTTPKPTPLARLNTAAMTIPRIDYCELVPKSAVRAALKAPALQVKAYGNGAAAPVGDSEDVVAEHLCDWSTLDGSASASTWIYARPVDASFAQRIRRDARHQKGCALTTGPAFGAPTLTQVCRSRAGIRVRHAGLFGDTWLTCEVRARATRPDVVQRADDWCVAVTEVLNTSR